MTFKKNEIEFESDKVKVYVQQLQAENALLRQANEEKKELLIKLGCPTKATAKRKVICLQQQLDQLKAENKHLNDLLNQALKELEKTRETLTEIKEFFNEECIICKENYINITGEICEECKYKDILQKISECEVENEQ